MLFWFIKNIFKSQTLTLFYGNRVLKFPHFAETQANTDRRISSRPKSTYITILPQQFPGRADKMRKREKNTCQDSRFWALNSQRPEYNDHCTPTIWRSVKKSYMSKYVTNSKHVLIRTGSTRILFPYVVYFLFCYYDSFFIPKNTRTHAEWTLTYHHCIFKVTGGKTVLPLTASVDTELQILFQDQRGAPQLQSLVNYRRGQLRERGRSKPLFSIDLGRILWSSSLSSFH
jgi:hypothetical protein